MTLRVASTFALAAVLVAAPALAAETKKSTAAPAPATAPGATAPTGGDPVVARVNNTDLHRSEVVEAMRSLPPQAQQQPIEKIYPYVLDEMVATIVVSQAARKAKIADDPEVKKRLALVQDQVIAQSYIQKLVEKSVTEPMLKTRYEKYIKDAPPRDEVSARHILLANETDAKAVIEELKKGGDFAKIAQEKTTDPAGKTSGGDLGYFTKEEMVGEFADAAFKLKPGEFTQAPVHTQFGWHVIKVEDRRTAKPPTFEQIRPQLFRDASREIVEAKMKELRTAAKIEVFNFDGSKLGAPAAAPSAAAPTPAPAPDAPTLSPATAPPPTLAPATAPPPTLSPATKPKE